MIKILKNLSRKEWMLLFVAVIFIVLQVWLDLKLPDYMSEITVLVQTEGSELSEVIAVGGKMLLCAFGSLVSAIAVSVFAAKVAANFSATLRAKLFDKVQAFSMEEIGHFSTASLITRTTNDVQQVQMLIVMGLQAIIKAPIMAVWAICKIYNKSWQWTTATAVAIGVLLVFFISCILFALPKFKKLQDYTDDLNRVTRENLTGLNVVRAYNAEDYQEKKFADANERLTRAQLFTNRTMAFLQPGVQLVMNGLTLSIYWIGAVLIDQARLTDKITLFSDIAEATGLNAAIVKTLLKMVGIGYLVEFSAGILSDFGQNSLADKLIFCGKILILVLAVPILESILSLVGELIGLIA